MVIMQTIKTRLRSRKGSSKKNEYTAHPPKTAVVIGGGWYGVEAAKALKDAGLDVVLLEKGHDLASGTSGKFSGRSHPTGLHYLRSAETRKDCIKDYRNFAGKYPKVLVKNNNAIHGLVYRDAQHRPPKVDASEFKRIYETDPTVKAFDQKKHGYTGLQDVVTIEEPSIINGNPLREIFRADLTAAHIPFFCEHEVLSIRKNDNSYTVVAKESSDEFDVVVNATGFQAFIPDNFDKNPFGVEPIYQPCIGLIYEDTRAEPEVFSFLALDGANPCVMPLGNNKYIVTHAIYTILVSCKTPGEARRALGRATDEFVTNTVKQLAEDDLIRYYPQFRERFKFIGWKAEVVAKPLTHTEYRSGFAFKAPDGSIPVFPGKIINAPRVAKDVVDLALGNNLVTDSDYSYVAGGTMAGAMKEIKLKPIGVGHNTCLSNTYPELLDNKEVSIGNAPQNFWGGSASMRRPRSCSDDFRASFGAVVL